VAGLPPLRNLRKTTVVVALVFFAFFVHRFVNFWMEDSSYQNFYGAELSPAQSVVCRDVVRGTPFGVDTVFEETTRLYFYSTISNAVSYSGDTLLHIWFWGTDTIQKVPCILKTEETRKGMDPRGQSQSTLSVCHTEIAPKLLKPGEWSVDLVAGRKLLSSKQFRIESDR
jgi:hypothetical protein